ncbi:copper resistance CopC family protein [Microbacterium sp. B24]|uniref:copper resistance CopC family protein n=1 Tax=Microbacterium sp. B24 TaxID=95616 RepID=UPI00055C6305|nr:copper resistance CopC family protein [Microbacterium sp. B24]
MSSSRFHLRAALLAATLAAAAVLVPAAPAAAHDELLASSPSPGAALDSAPTEVTLTFSADVLTIGAAVIVADGAGKDWAAAAPAVDNGVVSVPLVPALPAGGYEIRWRVVSQDGHPISGVVPFTIGGAAPLTRTPVATPATRAASDAATADTTPQDQSAREDQGIIRILLVGAGGAIIAVAAHAAFHLLRRKKGTSQ